MIRVNGKAAMRMLGVIACPGHPAFAAALE
jgi:hypothetical protein